MDHIPHTAAPEADSVPSPALELAPARSHTAPGSAAAPGTSRRWRSADLLGNAHEVEIEHGASVYRLRLTGMGKLILTK